MGRPEMGWDGHCHRTRAWSIQAPGNQELILFRHFWPITKESKKQNRFLYLRESTLNGFPIYSDSRIFWDLPSPTSTPDRWIESVFLASCEGLKNRGNFRLVLPSPISCISSNVSFRNPSAVDRQTGNIKQGRGGGNFPWGIATTRWLKDLDCQSKRDETNHVVAFALHIC